MIRLDKSKFFTEQKIKNPKILNHNTNASPNHSEKVSAARLTGRVIEPYYMGLEASILTPANIINSPIVKTLFLIYYLRLKYLCCKALF